MITVTNENFVRAETNRMLVGIQAQAGGVNRWRHNREPASIDEQTVIRMNRDTLYSFAVVNISEPATVTVPDARGRYLTVMVVNQDHYINRILTEPGDYPLTMVEFDTPYVVLVARILVDATDPDDVAEVNALQDGFALQAADGEPLVLPGYDEESFTATREALLAASADGLDTHGMFGSKGDVDPQRHRIGTAGGWGGLPEREAFYAGVAPHLPVGRYALTVKDVPVDAFWSVTVYGADGFLHKNELDAYSVNSVSGTKNADGSITVTFGGDARDPNPLPLDEGWNYTVRMYRPRPAILDGSWVFPACEPVT
ncbi:DUF1214 domain-containing protein [Promicromonospora sp. NPDC060204]|uniref:DUF1214 domain-containing protein n=1 Tax=Promicromonospora sp. NPDC060204 TaxID=3347071 RepID=UPI00365F89C1